MARSARPAARMRRIGSSAYRARIPRRVFGPLRPLRAVRRIPSQGLTEIRSSRTHHAKNPLSWARRVATVFGEALPPRVDTGHPSDWRRFRWAVMPSRVGSSSRVHFSEANTVAMRRACFSALRTRVSSSTIRAAVHALRALETSRRSSVTVGGGVSIAGASLALSAPLVNAFFAVLIPRSPPVRPSPPDNTPLPHCAAASASARPISAAHFQAWASARAWASSSSSWRMRWASPLRTRGL